MVRKKALLVLVAAVVVSGLWIGQAICQQETDPPTRPARPQRGERRRRSPEEWRKWMEQRRKEASERQRKTLGASEEEWKVLQPRIEKVRNLFRQLRAGAMRGWFGGAGMRMWRGRRQPAADDAAAERPKTDLEKKSEALRKILEDKESKPEAVKAALKGLREAREKLGKDLAKAKKELREIVTVRQEAHLVLMGVLD